MFGIKIIKEREYNKRISTLRDAVINEMDSRFKYQADCESLRKQLNDKMMEINELLSQRHNLKRKVYDLREFKRDTLEALGQIDLAGLRLSICNIKCESCDHEQQECKKFTFGSHLYCVTPVK